METVTGCPKKNSCVSIFLLEVFYFFAHQNLSEYLLRSMGMVWSCHEAYLLTVTSENRRRMAAVLRTKFADWSLLALIWIVECNPKLLISKFNVGSNQLRSPNIRGNLTWDTQRFLTLKLPTGKCMTFFDSMFPSVVADKSRIFFQPLKLRIGMCFNMKWLNIIQSCHIVNIIQSFHICFNKKWLNIMWLNMFQYVCSKLSKDVNIVLKTVNFLIWN